MADSIEGRSASLQGKTQMSSSDDLTDAKIEAAEARTDTKIVQLGGKIEMLSATLGAKLDSVNQRLSDHSNPEPYYWNYCIISYITRCFAHCSCYLWRCAFWTRDECSWRGPDCNQRATGNSKEGHGAAAAPLTSINRRSEDVRILPVIISELELGNIERHIFPAHFMERADNTAFEDRPEAFDGLSMDCADNMSSPGTSPKLDETE
jgi:hypothetical protein